MLGVLSGILCYSRNAQAAFPVGTLFCPWCCIAEGSASHHLQGSFPRLVRTVLAMRCLNQWENFAWRPRKLSRMEYSSMGCGFTSHEATQN